MSRAANILVVEDDTAMRQSCAKLFRLEGYSVVEASSGTDALEHIKEHGDINIVLTDIKAQIFDLVTPQVQLGTEGKPPTDCVGPFNLT